MPTALDKYRARADQTWSPGELAAAAGAGTTGLGALAFVGSHELQDYLANERVKRTKGFEDFVGKLEPGDVLFHHRNEKTSAKPFLGKTELPMTEADYMMLGKGDPYYHASVYMGGGNIADAYDFEHGIRKNTPIRSDVPENVRAYRPSKGIPKALRYAEKAHGSEYAGLGETIGHGLEHLFSPTGGPAASCAMSKNPQVCTQFVANAYPEIFKKQYASPAAMRHAKELDLIARYEPMGERSLRELTLTRGVYPVLKNLKYGAGAAALAYGGKRLYDYLKGDSDGREA